MKRFKTGANDVYDSEYIKLKNQSEILCPNSDDIPNVSTVFYDKQGCEDMLNEYMGDSEGYYFRNREKSLALIPAVRQKLKGIENEFEQFQESRVNLGFEIPTEMLPAMADRQSKLFALLDIYQEEVLKIQQRLASFSEKEDEKDDRMVLKYGLMCNGRLSDGYLVEMDGQRCGRNSDGLIIICDKRSPFNGISIPDYRKLAQTWQTERKASDREQLKKMKEQARAKGEELPKYFRSFGGAITVKKSLLPPWPEGVKNYLEESLVRTK